ncbi:hypothetical protein RchiOBHm_Chr1g0339751 [Rosa chinensis]|uniref:Uncharacterized protein n=1 Tax=Rosa chinensis TaxID=74649 RepID=A0A2P6SDB0_ROSCH|nr:hypothetical protein RchiOBHm_Chr1g0339751 [Rosa chinensis]
MKGEEEDEEQLHRLHSIQHGITMRVAELENCIAYFSYLVIEHLSELGVS